MRRLAATALALFAIAAAAAEPVSAATLDRVKEAGTIRIGYRLDARPHSYRDASGAPAGYIIDICTEVLGAIRKTLGNPDIRAEYTVVTAADRFTSVQAGTIDLLCEASSMTMARRAVVDFSMPTFVDGAGVLYNPGAPISTFADFAGKRVGVLAGTTTEQVVRDVIAGVNGKVELRPVESHKQAAGLVAGGELDAYVADRSILAMMIVGGEVPKGVHLSPRYFSYETYGLAFERGDDAFRLLVDRMLAQLSRSGRMEELFRKAMGAEPDELQRMLIAINAVPE